MNEEECAEVAQEQECRTVQENQCNVIEEEYCRDVTRPVCITKTELDCSSDSGSDNLNSEIPSSDFDGTGIIGDVNARSQPLVIAANRRSEGNSAEFSGMLTRNNSRQDEGKGTPNTEEEIFLSTGVFQRKAGDPIKQQSERNPRRLRRQTNAEFFT